MNYSEFLAPLSGLASMIAAWLGVRKASLEYKKVSEEDRQKVLAAGREAEMNVSRADESSAQRMVVSDAIVRRATKGIVEAEERFSNAIADITYTPAQIDQESKIARASVCRYLQLVKDHNEDELPPGELTRLWKAYRCDVPPDRD